MEQLKQVSVLPRIGNVWLIKTSTLFFPWNYLQHVSKLMFSAHTSETASTGRHCIDVDGFSTNVCCLNGLFTLDVNYIGSVHLCVLKKHFLLARTILITSLTSLYKALRSSFNPRWRHGTGAMRPLNYISYGAPSCDSTPILNCHSHATGLSPWEA